MSTSDPQDEIAALNARIQALEARLIVANAYLAKAVAQGLMICCIIQPRRAFAFTTSAPILDGGHADALALAELIQGPDLCPTCAAARAVAAAAEHPL